MKPPTPTAHMSLLHGTTHFKAQSPSIMPQVPLLGGYDHVEEWVEGACTSGGPAQVKQCLNDIDTMSSWTGHHVAGFQTKWTIDMGNGGPQPLFHTSAGRAGGQTCSLFFAKGYGDAATIVAVGHHTGPATYGIDYKMVSCQDIPNNIDLNKPQNIVCKTWAPGYPK